MMKNKGLSKKVLASLLTMSCVYLGGTSGLPTAEAADVTSNTDVSWRFQSGMHNFADGLEFVFSDNNFGGIAIDTWNPGVTTASPSQTLNARGSLKIHSLNSTINQSIGAYVYCRAAKSSLYGSGSDLYLTGEYNSNTGGRQIVEGLLVDGNGIPFTSIAESSAYAQFDNENTYLSAIVNPTNAITGDFAALSLKRNAAAVFNGNVYLDLQMNDKVNDNGSVLSNFGGGVVEFKGDKTILKGMSASTKDGRSLYGAWLQGNYAAGTVTNPMIDQMIISSKEASIDVTSSGSSNVFGIYAQLGGVKATGDVEKFSVAARATGVSTASGQREVRGIQAWNYETVDIQAKNTVISSYTDAAINAFNNTALFVWADGNINIGGEKAVITSSGASNGGVTLYSLGDASNISLAPGVAGNSGSDITINSDDITIVSAINGTGAATAAYAKALNTSATIHINSDAAGVAQGKTVNITGNVFATSYDTNLGGKVFLNLNNENSQFTGRTNYWPEKGNKSEINIGLSNNALWMMTNNSWVTNLKLNSNAIVDMRADGNGYSNLTLEKLSGTDGVIKQDIDVRSMESDMVFVTSDFSGTQALDIYQKDGYIPASDGTEGIGLVLASTNGGGTFTAKDYEGTLFHTHYDLGSKAGATAGFATDWYLKKLTKIDPPVAPTTSVDTVVSANALNYHTWRTENDKLLQRMGELRNNGDDIKGAWFRVKGSKIGREGQFGFENKYTAYELGYDELTKNTADVKRYQGASFSYTGGSSSYSRGSGDNRGTSVNFYNTESGSKGHYLDVVFRVSHMDNDFTVYDTHSNKITGDFNNTGVALSAEYGRKNNLKNGWYIEPQAQFTMGYFGCDNYTTSNGIEVDQSGIKSAVGRIGFNIGKEVGSKGIVYAKANLLHEFGGGYDVSMRDSSGAVTVSDSFNDTWFEYGIGAAVAMGSNSQLYVDIERSSGSDFKKDWTWNAGARWTF